MPDAGPFGPEVVDVLKARGATPDELANPSKDPFDVVMDVLYRAEPPSLTLGDVALQTGMAVEEVERMWRAFGLVPPDPEEVYFGVSDVATIATLSDVADFFGPDAAWRMARVAGSAMARVADAGTSSFVVSQPGVDAWPEQIPMDAFEANLLASEALPQFMDALMVLFRRHLQAVRRRTGPATLEEGTETQEYVVVFADVVGSTALGDRVSLSELSATLDRFEAAATDLVVAEGGRVVKFIGDEVMFVHADAGPAVAAATALLDPGHDLPPMRVGIDAGPVLSQDGDFFGPVVNVAARATSLARPGTILVTDAAATQLAEDIERRDCGPLDVAGHGPVRFWEISPHR